MSSNNAHVTDNWYIHLSAWNNRIAMRLLLWCSAAISRAGVLARGRTRERIEGIGRFLHNFALSIGRRETARLMADPHILKQALAETLGLTVFMTLTVVWTLLSIYGFLLIPLLQVLVLVVVLTLLFTHLIYLLALSGDIYQQRKDEGQRQATHQASATTLRFVGFVLVVLSLCLAFMPEWRGWVAIDLAVLVLLSRAVYLSSLAYLRWSSLAFIPLQDELLEQAR